MRLVCPNCDAEYEVDAAAIPEGGRDVQCSSCGHAWFQLPPDLIAAKEDEAALYDAEPDPVMAAVAAEVAAPVETVVPKGPVVEPAVGTVAEPVAEAAPEVLKPVQAPVTEPDSEPVALEPAAPLGGRSLDESLMAVLREEAEREANARKAEASGLETQTEMPLTAPAAVEASVGPATSALRKIAKLRGEPEPKPEPPSKADTSRPRRELLPEIEEINSSLRSVSEKRDVDQGMVADTLNEPETPTSGFRNGFLTVMVLVILGAALYIAAPALSAKVPALAGALAAYVHGVDALRAAVGVLARLITTKLTGVTGGQG